MESLLHYANGHFPGILYHGSTVELKEGDYLEPFESKILDGEKAVFATNDIICAMALAHKKMPEDYVFNDNIEMGFKKDSFYITDIYHGPLKRLYDNKAFIYLVLKETFKPDSRLGMQNHEFVSKERVRIEHVIPISNLWDDLCYLAQSKNSGRPYLSTDVFSLEFTTAHIHKILKSLTSPQIDEKTNNNNDNISNKNEMGTAKRFDVGKPRFSLIPPAPLEEIAKVLTMGAEKYGDRNWEKGMKWTRCIDSLERHLNAWKSGENLDKESGLPHLAHVCVNSMFLLQYEKTYPQGDDRK